MEYVALGLAVIVIGAIALYVVKKREATRGLPSSPYTGGPRKDAE